MKAAVAVENDHQSHIFSSPLGSFNKLIAFLSLVLLVISISSCARRATVVRVPTPPKQKYILLHVREISRLGKPLWINGKKYYPLSKLPGFVKYGMASWYGPKFHGKMTSSGEVYNMHGLTAAHKTLPLGTYVKVVNLKNGKSTVVKINDRGPFVKGRMIDLSYGAARRIDLVGAGVARVKMIVLGLEVGMWRSPAGPSPILQVPNLRQGAFTVQIGAFNDKRNALSIADRLKPLFKYVEVVPVKTSSGKGRTIFRVRVSRSKTLDEANIVRERLKRIGFEEAFVVSL